MCSIPELTAHVGKEANWLEKVEQGLVHDWDEVQTIYRRDRSEQFREVLRAVPVKEAMALTGLSRRQVYYVRSGQRLSGAIAVLER